MACDRRHQLNGNADHMTFIIEAIKDQRRTTDFRSRADVAVTLARRLATDGSAVSITTPSGDVYSADRFDLLLMHEGLNAQDQPAAAASRATQAAADDGQLP
jgi:hypothetical protein